MFSASCPGVADSAADLLTLGCLAHRDELLQSSPAGAQLSGSHQWCQTASESNPNKLQLYIKHPLPSRRGVMHLNLPVARRWECSQSPSSSGESILQIPAGRSPAPARLPSPSITPSPALARAAISSRAHSSICPSRGTHPPPTPHPEAPSFTPAPPPTSSRWPAAARKKSHVFPKQTG